MLPTTCTVLPALLSFVPALPFPCWTVLSLPYCTALAFLCTVSLHCFAWSFKPCPWSVGLGCPVGPPTSCLFLLAVIGFILVVLSPWPLQQTTNPRTCPCHGDSRRLELPTSWLLNLHTAGDRLTAKTLPCCSVMNMAASSDPRHPVRVDLHSSLGCTYAGSVRHVR